MIRQTVVILCAALGLSGLPVGAQTVSLDDFFELVKTGGFVEVKQSLHQSPSLATACDWFGSDIYAQKDEGLAPVHSLIGSKSLPASVAVGGDANTDDFKDRSHSIFHTMKNGPDDPFCFISAFLTDGASQNARDNRGKSVLAYAAALNDPELTGMLIQAGAIR